MKPNDSKCPISNNAEEKKKLRILFAMHFEAGHILCTYRLARELKAKGHSVTYLTIPDTQTIIEKQGFESILFAENIYSPQPMNADADKTAFTRYLRLITDGTLDNCLLKSEADILLCDPFLSYVAVRAASLNLPTINLFTSLFLYENTSIPPITAYCFPGTPFDMLFEWKMLFFKHFFTKKLTNLINKKFEHPTKMHHLTREYVDIAKKSGYPCIKNKSYRVNEIGFNLVLPEIVLCPQAFQYPTSNQDQRVYLGNFVDIDRQEAPLDIERSSKPLIYCSLGTAAAAYPYADNFYRAVLQAGALRTDWRFILQISDPHAASRYPSTENVLVKEWVPQLFVLRHAAAMVTHGGLNSIMECVLFNVPMVVVPGLRDQPGNAARAAYHDLAVTANMKRLEASAFIQSIEEAIASQRIQKGLKRMQEAIKQEDGLAASVAFIESHAAADKNGVL